MTTSSACCNGTAFLVKTQCYATYPENRGSALTGTKTELTSGPAIIHVLQLSKYLSYITFRGNSA